MSKTLPDQNDRAQIRCWELEPRPTGQGYNAKVLAELFNAKPREIKSFLSGQLASGRTQ
jgi:hypothetical protein